MRCSTSPFRLELIVIAVLIVTSVCIATENTNLLLNSGAEQGKNELPSIWYKARIPADGLKMYRDNEHAHSGNFSFTISNTHKYDQTVCNNWAQKIFDVPIGETIRLSAYIKTKDADSVNVCLQCWDASGNMLAFASTNVLRGDYDWTMLRAEPVTVPSKTAYICVRAVLTGLGKTWFDDIAVTVVDEPNEISNVNDELIKIVKGEIVKNIPLNKDCMVLSYMPKWQYGNIDNIAVANNNGGVRSLLSWFEISDKDANDPNHVFLIALYSRKTTLRLPVSKIEAYEILKDWPERTSWETQPPVAEKPVAKFKFVPGKGWKLFDITPLIRNQLKSKRKSYGLMLRFNQEKCSDKDWSGYAFVSREGLGQWLSKRPQLLIAKEKKQRKAD
jgi:hypothetical protein